MSERAEPSQWLQSSDLRNTRAVGDSRADSKRPCSLTRGLSEVVSVAQLLFLRTRHRSVADPPPPPAPRPLSAQCASGLHNQAMCCRQIKPNIPGANPVRTHNRQSRTHTTFWPFCVVQLLDLLQSTFVDPNCLGSTNKFIENSLTLLVLGASDNKPLSLLGSG